MLRKKKPFKKKTEKVVLTRYHYESLKRRITTLKKEQEGNKRERLGSWAISIAYSFLPLTAYSLLIYTKNPSGHNVLEILFITFALRPIDVLTISFAILGGAIIDTMTWKRKSRDYFLTIPPFLMLLIFPAILPNEACSDSNLDVTTAVMSGIVLLSSIGLGFYSKWRKD